MPKKDTSKALERMRPENRAKAEERLAKRDERKAAFTAAKDARFEAKLEGMNPRRVAAMRARRERADARRR